MSVEGRTRTGKVACLSRRPMLEHHIDRCCAGHQRTETEEDSRPGRLLAQGESGRGTERVLQA